MQDTWSHVEFKFTQHKGTDVYLVRMAEEDFEALEDNQVLVQVTDNLRGQALASAVVKPQPFTEQLSAGMILTQCAHLQE